jgi:Fibronectin type III domain
VRLCSVADHIKAYQINSLTTNVPLLHTSAEVLNPASRMTLFRTLLAAAILSILPLTARAADVTLAWDSNVEQDIAGYHVGYGLAPGSYSSIIDVGNTTAYKVFNLEANRTYYFVVRAYNFQGLMSPFSAAVSTTTPPPPLIMTSVSMNQSSPKPVGTAVMFAANASGGAPPYQFKWFVANGLAAPTVVRDWSTTATYTWQPAVAGTYQITAWVRSAGSVTDAAGPSATMTVPFRIDPATTTAPKPVTVGAPIPSLASPQRVGTAIRFTANGAGGVPPLQYRWLVSTGQGYVIRQNWGTSNSFVWTPTVAGSLLVRVQVRSATNTTDIYEAQHVVLMTIVP